MELARHCELCDYQQIDFVEGSICQLTNQKPAFSRTCSKIQLSTKFEERLEKINVQYELAKRQKTIAIAYLIVFLLISAIVFFIAYILGKKAILAGAFSFVNIVLYGVGGLVFLIAFKPLASYLRDMEVAKMNKKNIDTILNNYNINYSFRVRFGKKIHGEQHYETQLDINR